MKQLGNLVCVCMSVYVCLIFWRRKAVLFHSTKKMQVSNLRSKQLGYV